MDVDMMPNAVIYVRTHYGEDYITNEDGTVKIFDSADAAREYLEQYDWPDVKESQIRESVGRCRLCGSPLFESDIEEYDCQCFDCDEDFFDFEQAIEMLKEEISVQLCIARDVLFAEREDH